MGGTSKRQPQITGVFTVFLCIGEKEGMSMVAFFQARCDALRSRPAERTARRSLPHPRPQGSAKTIKA